MLYTSLAILGAVVIVVWLTVQIVHVVMNYRQATGTKWQRFLAAFHDSLTIMLARVLKFFGAISAFLSWLYPNLDPSSPFGQWLSSIFQPEYAKYYLGSFLVLGMLFEYVRKRPGSVDPITPTPTEVTP